MHVPNLGCCAPRLVTEEKSWCAPWHVLGVVNVKVLFKWGCGTFTFVVWWWYIECLNWRPAWKQKNDFCEWDRLEIWMPTLGITYWISNVLPHVTKREWTWCPPFETLFARVVLLCDVTSCVFMFGLCCALYSPILVLAWRIHDISPCYGGLPPRLL